MRIHANTVDDAIRWADLRAKETGKVFEVWYQENGDQFERREVFRVVEQKDVRPFGEHPFGERCYVTPNKQEKSK